MAPDFDPTGKVIIKFRLGQSDLSLPGGLEVETHGVWLAPGVEGIKFNNRGVGIIDASGEIQRPWYAYAINPPQRCSELARRVPATTGSISPEPLEVEQSEPEDWRW